MRVALILAAAFLSACATPTALPTPIPPPEPVIVYRDRDVPVPVSCVAANVDRTAPAYPDTKAAIMGAPGIRELAQIVAEANVMLHARADVLEAVLKGCLTP